MHNNVANVLMYLFSTFTAALNGILVSILIIIGRHLSRVLHPELGVENQREERKEGSTRNISSNNHLKIRRIRC